MDRTPLQQAAVCALAELIGQYEDDNLDVDGIRTIVELADALTADGVNLDDYQDELAAVEEHYADLRRYLAEHGN